jgi:excinuclease ABC subunit C
LETKAIASDLSEFNQEPVEDAVKRAQSLVEFETGPPDKVETEAIEELEPGPLESVETGAPDELEVRTPEKRKSGQERLVRLPDLIIVDGGKGQLNAACRELQRLGLSERPIIG